MLIKRKLLSLLNKQTNIKPIILLSFTILLGSYFKSPMINLLG